MRASFRSSSALKSGVRASPERGQALLEIGCPAGEFQVEEFLGHGLVQRGVLAVVDGLLGQSDRHGRPGRPAGPAAPRRRRRVRPRSRSGGSGPSRRRRRRSPSRRAAASRLARARPTSRGSSQVEPESGLKPRVEERLPEHRVVGGDGEVGGQGQIAAQADRPAPHPAHHRQVDACATSSITRLAVCGMRRTRSPVRGRWPPLLVATQSAPAQKSSPAPRMWMARSESSVAASVSTSTNASIIGWLNELRRDGRSSVSRRTRRRAMPSPSRRRRPPESPSNPPFRIYTVSHTVGDTIAILYKLARKAAERNTR